MRTTNWRHGAKLFLVGAFSFVASFAILQGCGGGGGSGLLSGGSGSGGGNGGGNGGGTVVNNFTVSPASAMPGTVVTLSGVRLNGTDPVTVSFGGVATAIKSRSGNAQVVVPVFLNKGGTAIQMPSGPVKVSVRIGGGAAKDSTNSFTVKALPAAPGTAVELVAQMKGFSAFLGDTAVNGMLPLTTGADAVLNRGQVVQAIALASAAQKLLSGADNPDSLLALVNGTAPLAGGAKLPKPVLDSVLAQSGALTNLKTLATRFAAIVDAVEPAALTAGNGLRSGRVGPRIINQEFDFGPKAPKIDWTKLTPAQRIVVLIQNARLLQSSNDALGFIDNFNTNYISVVAAVADAVPLPQFQGVAKLIQTESLIVAVVSKLHTAFTSLVPSKLTQFYIVVSGTNRQVGTAPINLVKGDAVGLDAFIGVKSPGGPIITPAGILGLVLAAYSPKIPGRVGDRFRDVLNAPADRDLLGFLRTEILLTGLENSANALLGKVIGEVDTIWVNYTGNHPPKEYLDRGTLVIRLPEQKLKPFKINDGKTTDPQRGVVTIEALGKFNAPVPPSVTTNDFLSVTRNSNGTYTLKTLKSTSSAGAGFFGALRDVKILPNAPSLRQIALDDGVNVNVRGVVTIACPNTRAGDCNEPDLPPGCLPCGKGSSCDYKPDGTYTGGCSETNNYPGCCDDYPCSPSCVR